MTYAGNPIGAAPYAGASGDPVGTYALNWSPSTVGKTIVYPEGMLLETADVPAGATGAVRFPFLGPALNNVTRSWTLSLTLAAAGEVKFHRKVSSDTNFDGLRFFVDGTERAFYTGEVAWGEVTHALTAGAHTMEWRYTKDTTVTVGSDTAWVALLSVTNVENPPDVRTSTRVAKVYDFEDGLIPPEITGTWTNSTSAPISGTRSLRSPAVGGNTTNSAVITATYPENAVVTLDWKSDSDYSDDFEILHNTTVAKPILGGTVNSESGTTRVIVRAGTETITCRYVKDGSFTAGQDAAFIDNLSIPMQVVPTTHAQQVMADGPIAYYKLNEASGTFQDSSGYTRHMTTSQPHLYAQPPVITSTGKSAQFEDPPDNRRARIAQAAWMNTNHFTATALVKLVNLPPASPGSGVILCHDADGAQDALAYRFSVTSAGKLDCAIRPAASPSTVVAVLGTTTLVAGTSYHVAASYDGTTLRVFVNGVQDGSTAYTGTLVLPTSGNSGLVIGNYSPSDAGFPGYIDEVAFYGTALSPARVAAQYNAAAPYATAVLADAPLAYWRLGDASGTTMTDSSGNARNGTYASSPTLGAVSLLANESDTSVDFTGTNHANVTYASWMNTSAITVDMLIRADTLPASGAQAFLMQRDTGSGADRVFHFRLQNTGGVTKLHALLWNEANTNFEVNGTTTILAGTTYHVALTYDGTTARLYLNGVQDGSTAMTGALAARSLDTRIASYYLGTLLFDGRLDEIAYYGTALPAARISAHSLAAGASAIASASGSLTLGSTAVAAPLTVTGSLSFSGSATARSAYVKEVFTDTPTAYWRLGETSGTTMIDSSGNARNGVYTSLPTSATSLLVGDTDPSSTFSTHTGQIATHAAWMDTFYWTASAVIHPTTLTGQNRTIVAHDDNGSAIAWRFFVGTDGTLHCYFKATDNTLRIVSSAAGLIAINTTYHVAATYDGTGGRLYINGSQVAFAAFAGTQTAITTGMVVGRLSNGGEAFAGRLDEIAVYGTALSAARISAQSVVAGTGVPSTAAVASGFLAFGGTAGAATPKPPSRSGSLITRKEVARGPSALGIEETLFDQEFFGAPPLSVNAGGLSLGGTAGSASFTAHTGATGSLSFGGSAGAPLPVTLVERVEASSTANISTYTATTTVTPQAGDVVVVLSNSAGSNARTISSVTGMGATWSLGVQHTRHGVWFGTGATTAGAVSVTHSGTNNGKIVVYVLRGVTTAVDSASLAPGGTSSAGTYSAPTVTAGQGQFVIVSASANDTMTFPSATTPSVGWSSQNTDAGTHGAGDAWRSVTGFSTGHSVDILIPTSVLNIVTFGIGTKSEPVAAAASTAGSLTFGGTASALVAATATGSLSLLGTASAAGTAPASATGAFDLSGTANAGVGQLAATASGSLALSGSAVSGAQAIAAGSLVLSGTALAVEPQARTAAGSLILSGSANLAGSSAAAAAGTLALSGIATAINGAIAASATGALVFTGSAGAAAGPVTATGSLSLSGIHGTPGGETSGSLSLSGTATAQAAPTPPTRTTGSLSLSGTATPRGAAAATGSLFFTAKSVQADLTGVGNFTVLVTGVTTVGSSTGVGSFTATAVQFVSTSAALIGTGEFTAVAYAPATPGTPPPGVSEGIVRWVFKDIVTHERVVVPINPREMSTPTMSRSMSWAWGAAPGAVMRGVDQGSQQPMEWSFGGVLLTKSHYDLLLDWTKRLATLEITDHLDRTFETIIQKFDPVERLPTPAREWRADYTMNCLLLRRIP